jgi:hypothetical protein
MKSCKRAKSVRACRDGPAGDNSDAQVSFFCRISFPPKTGNCTDIHSAYVLFFGEKRKKRVEDI